MGHTTVSDLLQSLKSSLTALNPAGVTQLSIDGLHTNWKPFEELTEDRNISDPELPQIINTGSYGLHIVHGAFKTGAVATGWHTDNLLKSLQYLFSDSPAKREDYMKVSTMKKLPLQFCATRWLEDIAFTKRAIIIWPDIKVYITQDPSLKFQRTTALQLYKDISKIFSFQHSYSSAKMLHPFLEVFQTERQ